VALVHLDATDQSERVVDAIRATAAKTEDDIREMQEDEAMTRSTLDLLTGDPRACPRLVHTIPRLSTKMPERATEASSACVGA
jgi:hypothetical protein